MKMRVRIPAARCVRALRFIPPPHDAEGAGKTGCALHPLLPPSDDVRFAFYNSYLRRSTNSAMPLAPYLSACSAPANSRYVGGRKTRRASPPLGAWAGPATIIVTLQGGEIVCAQLTTIKHLVAGRDRKPAIAGALNRVGLANGLIRRPDPCGRPCGMLRRDTAASFVNLCVCRALASRPRLSSRRGVFGDVIPDESAGSTTDISACVTGPCRGCRNHETYGRCDDKRTSQSQRTKSLETRLDNFTHVKTPCGFSGCIERQQRCAARPTRCLRVPHVELTPIAFSALLSSWPLPKFVMLMNQCGAPVRDPTGLKGNEPGPSGRRGRRCAAAKPTPDGLA